MDWPPKWLLAFLCVAPVSGPCRSSSRSIRESRYAKLDWNEFSLLLALLPCAKRVVLVMVHSAREPCREQTPRGKIQFALKIFEMQD